MKLNFTSVRALALGAVAVLCSALPTASRAELLSSEDFDYPAGKLFGNPGWCNIGTKVNDPIQVVSTNLTYPGYKAAAAGNAVRLTGQGDQTAQECLWRSLGDVAAVKTGDIYMSALVRVEQAPVGNVYVLAFTAGSSTISVPTSGKSPSEFTRLFVSPGSSDQTFKFGLSKNGAAPLVQTDEMQLNTTYLVVLKHSFVSGTTNDIATLMVNPTAAGESADALSTTAAADPSDKYGFIGYELRQGNASGKTTPTMTIDAVRVATDYASLWAEGGSEDPNPPAPTGGVITASASTVSFGNVWQYSSATATVTVSGSDLTAPVSVSTPAGVTASATNISADEAMAGYQLTLTYKANAALAADAALTLSSQGAETVSIPLTALMTPATAQNNMNFFNQLSDGDETLYYYGGNATVTYIDAANNLFYAKDMIGAGCFSYDLLGECPVAVGDKVKNFYTMLNSVSFGAVKMELFSVPTVVSSGNTVSATPVSLSELSRDPGTYIYRLVEVSDLTFGSPGQPFTTTGVAVTSGDAQGRVRPFAGTDVLGTEIPAKASSVVGISTSASAAIISVRSLADITAVTAPEATLELSVENLIDPTAWQPVGSSIAFATVTVTYANLPQAAPIYITGAQGSMFSADVTEIPAGSGTQVINITYQPTAVGVHKANFMIDAMPTHLSTSKTMTAKAYDPANPPALSVDASGLTQFSAQPGESVTQTVAYTVSRALDYGNIRLVQPASGAFRLSSTSMLKTDGTYQLTVTFNPKAAGTYTDVIEFVTPMAETVSVSLSGVCQGQQPGEQLQGDVITDADLSTANALALCVQDFSTAIADNKPLSIDGWKNAAIAGTRAWWSYTVDGNKVAKVTAYDSKAAEDTQAQMLLMSPALDFVNAAQPLLSFRVMGDFLNGNATDDLTVAVIDPATNAATALSTSLDVLSKVWIEPIGGLGIPSISDQNKQWQDYIIDLHGQPMPERFFIGFFYTSQRGTNTTAVYYIDDFSWGRGDVPFIRPLHKAVEFSTAENSLSKSVTVHGLNLGQPIAVSVTGKDAKAFTTSVTELPAAGGQFNISWDGSGDQHEAYVKLSSAGAPDAYIALSGSAQTSIDGIAADGAEVEGIYTLTGARVSATPAPGLYIVRYTDGTSAKVVIK